MGNYRVGYTVDDTANEVVIIRIGHRSEFYGLAHTTLVSQLIEGDGMSDKKAVVHVSPCTNAEEFFHLISPLSEYFRDYENFYFRGHADDRWELVPNAQSAQPSRNHRSNVFAGYYGAARAVMEERYLGRMS